MGEVPVCPHDRYDHVGTVECEGEQGSVEHRRLHKVEEGERGIGLPLFNLGTKLSN